MKKWEFNIVCSNICREIKENFSDKEDLLIKLIEILRREYTPKKSKKIIRREYPYFFFLAIALHDKHLVRFCKNFAKFYLSAENEEEIEKFSNNMRKTDIPVLLEEQQFKEDMYFLGNHSIMYFKKTKKEEHRKIEIILQPEGDKLKRIFEDNSFCDKLKDLKLRDVEPYIKFLLNSIVP